MRLGIIGLCLGLAACATNVRQTSPGTFEALDQYYASLDIDLPRAPTGAAALPADTLLTKIAMGSCQASWKPIPILDAVAREEAQLFLYLGDNVYGDTRRGNADLPNLRQQYADLAKREEFARLRSSTPILATWDDHDYGLNDAGGDFAFKRWAKEIFLTFWGEDETSVHRTREGLYDSRIYGPEGSRVQIIMLDTRSFRSSPLIPSDDRGAPGKERYLKSHDPAMTMLGEAQWQWFADELKKPADIRLVVSSIQVIAADHGWEAWAEFLPQRQRFFDTVKQSGAKGVVVISGDRHIAAFYRHEGDTDYPLYEFTSSALNMSFTKDAREMDKEQLVPAFGPNNFGLVDIDWQGRTLHWTIKDVDGQVQRELNLAFTDIGLG